MSTVGLPQELTSPDLATTPGVPLSRLVRVELRKMADTRAGLSLLTATVLVTAGIVVAFYLGAPAEERTFVNLVGVTSTPQGLLLPVLAILLVTSEWSQRTALVTFSLVPHKLTVLLAKAVAAVLVGLAAIVVAVASAAVATQVAQEPGAWSGMGRDLLAELALAQVLGILQGLAFGLLLLSSAAAVVAFLVLPIGFTVVASTWAAMDRARPWVDLGYSQALLFDGTNPTAEQWGQVSSGLTLWVVLPMLLGTWRVLHREVR